MKILSSFFVVLLCSSRALSDEKPEDVIECHEKFTENTNRTYSDDTECLIEKTYEYKAS